MLWSGWLIPGSRKLGAPCGSYLGVSVLDLRQHGTHHGVPLGLAVPPCDEFWSIVGACLPPPLD